MKIHSSLGKEELIEDFLKLCEDAIYSLQVWPPNNETICTEFMVACNYLIICSSRQRRERIALPQIESSRANKLLIHILQRVNQYLCNHPSPKSTTSTISTTECSVYNHLMQIVSFFENPLIHFKGLDIMGHFLALVCVWCVYTRQIDGTAEEGIISCLIRMKKLANGSVLKEQLPQYQGLLLCTPLEDDQQQDRVSPCVEDLMCLIFVAFNHPSNLSMVHEPWKWIYLCLNCKQIMKGKNYSAALSQLYEALKIDLDPEIKAIIMCLFAECYNKQGYHQLAIQAYRDALQIDNGYCSVLWHLSLVYQALNKNDLELECLNLLVSMLSDAQERSQGQRIDCNIDEIIWSIFSPVPIITLPVAMYIFALRCFQLKRYTESAAQYFDLVQKLNSGSLFLEFTNANVVEVDVRQLAVEAAEALLMDERHNDCLNICNHVCSCLSVNDSFEPQHKQNKTWNPFDDEHCTPPLFLSDDVTHVSSTDFLRDSGEMGTNVTGMSHLLNGLFPEKMLGESVYRGHSSIETRKRLRSDDAIQNEETGSKDKMYFLNVRALLCKSDALIKTDGYTNDAFCVLSQALEVLLNYPGRPHDDFTRSPSLKRQRISSDSTSHNVVPKQEELDNDSIEDSSGQNKWSSLVLNTALRMGKASLERKRFPSVMNSCLLVQQIDADNIEASYLKTITLRENQYTKMKSSSEWLQKRGVNDTENTTKLKASLQEKKALENVQDQSSAERKWWQISEQQCVDLDIQCLQYLLEMR